MKLLKWFGIAAATIAAKKSKTTADMAKSLDVKEADLEKFLKGDADLEIEAGGIDDLAEAAGGTSGELTEAAIEAQAADEAKSAEEKKKADEEAASKRKSDDDAAIKKGKQGNGVKKFNVITIPDGGSLKKSEKKTDNIDDEPVERTKGQMIANVSKALFSPEMRESLTKGILSPGMVSPGGVLTPEQSQDVLGLVSARNQFMQKIQKVNMNSTKQDVTVWDIAGRKMKRFKAGFWPTADTHTGSVVNKAITLVAHKVNLDILIDDKAIRAHQHNWPAMESDLISGFATHFGNEAFDLLLNGEEDGTESEELTWEELLKGWLVKADEGVPIGNKISFAGLAGATVPKDMWNEAKRLAAANRRFFGEAEYVISGVDWEDHEEDLLTRVDATPFLINGAPMKYRNRTVNDIDYLAEKTGFYCNPKNFVAGFVTGGNDGFEFKTYIVPDGLLIRFTGYMATGFVNVDEGIILMQP